MRLLLDTHILLWWLMGDRRLPKELAKAVGSPENDIAVSAASLWEIVIKHMLGGSRSISTSCSRLWRVMGSASCRCSFATR